MNSVFSTPNTHEQRHSGISTNQRRAWLTRALRPSNRRTQTTIVVVKGVYYKSFLHSVVCIIGQHTLFCLQLSTSREWTENRKFLAADDTVRFIFPFP